MNMKTRIAIGTVILLLLFCMIATANTNIINAHQVYRGEVGSPALAWSSTIATNAQDFANYLAANGIFKHSDGTQWDKGYGENIALGTAGSTTWPGIVNMWASEQSMFKYGIFPDVRNTVACPSGTTCNWDWRDVGHYTQVVWRNTTECGCGKATGQYQGVSMDVFVCQYNPPGNVMGHYPYTALPPPSTWAKAFGGTGSDVGNSVRQTKDGGYIIAGSTNSFGNGWQVYLIKTNAKGTAQWSKNYGGTGIEVGNSVQQTSDGGYILTGYTDSFGKREQVYLVKTTAKGVQQWAKAIGDIQSEEGTSLQQTSDGGYIIAGSTNSFGKGVQVYLVKTNAKGTVLWSKQYGGTASDHGYDIQLTKDGGYIIVGYSNSFGNGDQVYLIKTNAQGAQQWAKVFGGTGSEYGYAVQQTKDGGYIVVGASDSFGKGDQVYLIKTNAQGTQQWAKVIGGTEDEYGSFVQQTKDGGYIVTGPSDSFGNGVQLFLLKTTAKGAQQWIKAHGGTGTETGNSVQQTSDGGYIAAGYTTSMGNGPQVYLIKRGQGG